METFGNRFERKTSNENKGFELAIPKTGNVC
jgi:hypothetical protein